MVAYTHKALKRCYPEEKFAIVTVDNETGNAFEALDNYNDDQLFTINDIVISTLGKHRIYVEEVEIYD
jgi:NRPS condensation-like uncharacterized protein